MVARMPDMAGGTNRVGERGCQRVPVGEPVGLSHTYSLYRRRPKDWAAKVWRCAKPNLVI